MSTPIFVIFDAIYCTFLNIDGFDLSHFTSLNLKWLSCQVLEMSVNETYLSQSSQLRQSSQSSPRPTVPSIPNIHFASHEELVSLPWKIEQSFSQTRYNGSESNGYPPTTDIKNLAPSCQFLLISMLAIMEIRLWWMKIVGPLTSVIAGFDFIS